MRRLASFWVRLQGQANQINGLSAFVAAVPTVAGFLAAGEVLRTVLLAMGFGLFGILFVVTVWRSIPPKLRTPEEAQGEELYIEDLKSIEPAVPVIGILGAPKTGKTTLRNLLLHRPTPRVEEPTRKVLVHISAVISSPATFLAVADGRGELYSHQFDVAQVASILCVLLDNHLVEGQETAAATRLEAHREFGRQIRHHVSQEWERTAPSRPIAVHLLLNKRDHWARGPEADQDELRTLLLGEHKEWEALRWVSTVTSAEHSNTSASDIAKVHEAIKSHWNTLEIERSRTA